MSRMNEGQENQGGQEGDQSQAQSLRDVGDQVGNMAREQYDQLRQQATEYYSQGREMATDWQEQLEQYVHEQPVKSLLIAAGVGMLLGVLWKKS